MKEGWEFKTLGEIATEMYRGSGIKRDQVTKEGTPCVRYGEIYTTYNISFDTCASHTKIENVTSPKYFEYGDLLFAITGESVEDIGKTIAYLGDEKCLCGGDIICMKHHQNPKYLAYALSTPDAIRQKGIGKTKLKVVHTNAPAFKAISIPLAPLSEQQSIVDYLDSAFAKIDAMKANAEKRLNEAKALFQASLKKMLEPQKGWEEKYLKDIAEYSIGLTYKPTDVCKDGTIVLRSSNIQEGKLDLNDIVRVTTNIKDKLYVQSGDILMCSRNGSARLVGKVCIIPDLKEKMTYGTFMMVVRSAYNPLLYHYFDTDLFRRQIKHGEANMINQITRYMLDEVKLNLPPIKEQQTIVATLDNIKSKVDKLQANYDKISQECDALKQAVLRQVFE